MNSDTDYRLLTDQAMALLAGHRDRVANAANLCALLWQELPAVNWVGFYFLAGNDLVLGPFQGKPACVSIPVGKGVCGAAAASREVQRVPDVHAFEGHIACDVESRSELVIPLLKDGELLGVLDLDSPELGRFGPEDEMGVSALAQAWLDSVD